MTEQEIIPPFNLSNAIAENAELFGKVFTGNRLFNEREYTAGDTDLSYRVINYWGKNHVLPQGVKKTKGWHKFSFIELLWLRTVTHLRNFGFSLKKIAHIKKQVMVYDKKNDVYPVFESHAVRAMYADDNPSLVVLADSSADIGSSIEIELAKYHNQQDMLLIPIKSILNEMGIMTKKASLLISLDLNELSLLSAIKAGNYETVLLKLKNGKIERIEKTENLGAVERSYERVREIVKAGGYQEVTLKIEDGKTVNIKRTIKLK